MKCHVKRTDVQFANGATPVNTRRQMLGGKSRHKSSTSFSSYLFSPLNICHQKGKTHLKSSSASWSRSRNPIPSQHSPSPRCLGCSGVGWLANIFSLRVFLLQVPHPPRFCLGLSETFDPEKHIGSRLGKAETNQLPF